MRTIKLLFPILATLLIVACGEKSIKNEVKARIANAQEIEDMAPDRAKLVFDNEFVKAIAVELAPGVSLPAYPARDRMFYALTDCSLGFDSNGIMKPYSWKKGQAAWIAAGEQSITNNGEKPARFLIASRITSGLPGLREVPSDQTLSDVAPQIASSILDNEAIQITEVKIPPKKESPVFEGVNSLIYSLNLSELKHGKVTGPDSTAKVIFEEQTIMPGTAIWQERGRQVLSNPGEVEANFLVIAFME
jgi:hypothetical protein